MKLIILACVVAFLAVGCARGQEPPTSFSFTWESGEQSRDMSIQTAVWKLSGRTLRYSASSLGRAEQMPVMKSLFRDTVVLTGSQLDRMTSILETLVNENSVSLLPSNHEGTLTSYTLSFGTPPRLVSFEAAQYSTDHMAKETSSGAAKSSGSDPGSILFFKMNVLRDYLMELSRRS
ncbi:MAG: hypothetical protein ABSF77_02835 [Spirochaetia bacterium]|jgi:hypothetical protein